MKTEFFIASRIIQGNQSKNKLSKPIIIISLASIIIGIAVMIVAVSVVTGFQEGIRDKVIGFGSHIQITKDGLSNSMESDPLLIKQPFYAELNQKKEVQNVQIFAYKPAILQAKRDDVVFTHNNKDTIHSTQDILGVLFKGIGKDYDTTFFADKLIDGKLIDFNNPNNQTLVSAYICDKMGYKVGDEIEAFFIRDTQGPKKEKFVISGIYRSGFEEFDKKLIFTRIGHIQKLNNWGVQTFITVLDTCIDKQFVLKAITKGGTGKYQYDWGNGFQDSPYHKFSGKVTERIQLISSDIAAVDFGARNEISSIPDTAFANITINSPCSCDELISNESFEYKTTNQIITPFGEVNTTNGFGTQNLYTSGFEVILREWDDLTKLNEIVYETIPYDMKTTEITETHRDIFAWLDLLDMNILIIIALILLVSLINMVTSLLVLILEKTNMIGILKSVGVKNRSIRTIFIFHAIFLLTRGIFFGNLLGIGIIAFQYFTGFFTLDAEVYSLDVVPVSINFMHIIYINLLTLVTCLIILIIPSYLVTKIDPVKAIRFD
ncbi:ABC transporter permease [Crocinitomix catalasitica]|uniref:ABC transporter permease n=1 Tax=Crocinitomix catalasitica TaxID=184607 RepID=UPI000488E620|nr:FtsX-like permease family protein [Crocinitomix catalasitica]